MTGKEVTSPQVSSKGHMIEMADGMATNRKVKPKAVDGGRQQPTHQHLMKHLITSRLYAYPPANQR